jgi:hypothetical protein
VVWLFFYRAVWGVFGLLALRLRSSEYKEIEIVVLRSQRSVGRCRDRRGRRSPSAQRPCCAGIAGWWRVTGPTTAAPLVARRSMRNFRC